MEYFFMWLGATVAGWAIGLAICFAITPYLDRAAERGSIRLGSFVLRKRT